MIIIDDEYLVRIGIEKTIAWKDYDIQIVGTASNGLVGYNLVMKEKPDIVISDIRMPLLSGVEMIKKLSESDFDGEIIVLSGYKDFEYAIETFKSGIFSYILKPIDNAEFISVVLNAIEKLKEKRKDKMLKSTLSNSLPAMQNNYINSLLSFVDTISGDIIKDELERLGIDLPQSGSIFYMRAESNDTFSFSDGEKALLQIFVELEKVGIKFMKFSLPSYSVVFLYTLNKDLVVSAAMKGFSAFEKSSCTIFTASVICYHSIEEIPAVYHDCVKLVDKKLLLGFNTVEAKLDCKVSSRHYAAIMNLYKVISTDYAKPITVSYVADKMGVSESYLMHLLQASLGKTFNEILTGYRISLAKRLLKDGKYRINEISDMVGYADAKYFSRVFNKIVGVNPSDYDS